MSNELEIDNGLVVTGNITGGMFYGDGSNLQGIGVDLTNVTTDISGSGDLTVVGNVSASSFYGDGTTLSGIGVYRDDLNNEVKTYPGDTLVANLLEVGGDSDIATEDYSGFINLGSNVDSDGTSHGNVFSGSYATTDNTIETSFSDSGITIVPSLCEVKDASGANITDGSKVRIRHSTDNGLTWTPSVDDSTPVLTYGLDVSSGTYIITGGQWSAAVAIFDGSNNTSPYAYSITNYDVNNHTGTYVGQDFGAGNEKNIRRIRFHQHSGTLTNSIVIAYSDDGVSYTSIGSFVTVGGDNIIDFSGVGARRYWIIGITDPAGATVNVGEIDMFEASTYSNPSELLSTFKAREPIFSSGIFQVELSGVEEQRISSFERVSQNYKTSLSHLGLEYKLDDVTIATIDNDGNLTATGNVSASSFYGDGSNLTGVATDLTNITTNIVTTGDISGNLLYGDGSNITNLTLPSPDGVSIVLEESALAKTGAIATAIAEWLDVPYDSFANNGGKTYNSTTGEYSSDVSFVLLLFRDGGTNVTVPAGDYYTLAESSVSSMTFQNNSFTDVGTFSNQGAYANGFNLWKCTLGSDAPIMRFIANCNAGTKIKLVDYVDAYSVSDSFLPQAIATTDSPTFDNLTTTGNVSASSFYGDGSNLTGVATDLTNITTNISGNGDLTVVGNVSASELNLSGNNITISEAGTLELGSNTILSENILNAEFDVSDISSGETLYDGIDDYAQCTSATLRMSTTQTWCAEFRRSALTNDNQTIIANNNGASGILIQLNTSNLVRGLAYGSTVSDMLSSTTPSAGEWYKVVFVLDSSEGRLYLNGSQEGSDPLAGYSTSTGNFRIANDVNSNYFSGDIRNVEIYSGAATNPSDWIPGDTSSLNGTTLVMQSRTGIGSDNQQGLSFTTTSSPIVNDILSTEVGLNLDNLAQPISTTQDISANAFYGDGSNLTGVASSVDLENVTTDINTTQNISATGNISGAEFHGSGQYITGVVKGYVDNTVGDNSTNPITITHNLGTKDVMVVIRDNGTDKLGMASITATSTNAISVEFAVTPTTNQYSITIFALV